MTTRQFEPTATGYFANPILAGCYPDPSVCRVGDEYFLATSTFEYFPGLPIFRSTDLVNWQQIGHTIDRESQLDLSTVASSEGLYAPSIRYHNGTFYIVNTLVGGDGKQGNFIVTATDAAGPWSDPVWLHDADGFDPSLLFEDDRTWLCGTRLADPGLWEGQTDVWLRELDTDTLTLIGEEFLLWRGALVRARWVEAPHIYRVGGRYYLVTAEGGTARDHAVCVAVSDTITGPYTGNPANPVLTHRNLGGSAPIVAVGHADLVQTPSGQWWAVLLAIRTTNSEEGLLGRETNLVPVSWEHDWPVFAPGSARVEAIMAGPAAVPSPVILRDDFDSHSLSLEWNLVRTTTDVRYELAARPSWLRLPLRAESLAQLGTPAFVGRRLQHSHVWVRALMDFTPSAAGDWAGLAVRQSEDAHIVLAVAGDDDGSRRIIAVKRAGGMDTVLGEQSIATGDVTLGIRFVDTRCVLEFTIHSVTTELAVTSTRELSSAVAGGFLGVWVGMYASGNGLASDAVADFDWFEYRNLDDEQ